MNIYDKALALKAHGFDIVGLTVDHDGCEARTVFNYQGNVPVRVTTKGGLISTCDFLDHLARPTLLEQITEIFGRDTDAWIRGGALPTGFEERAMHALRLKFLEQRRAAPGDD